MGSGGAPNLAAAVIMKRQNRIKRVERRNAVKNHNKQKEEKEGRILRATERRGLWF